MKKTLSLLVLVLLGIGAQEASAQNCVDPKTLSVSVLKVSLPSPPGTTSRSGTGWLYRSQQLLVTNHHVAEALGFHLGVAQPLILHQ